MILLSLLCFLDFVFIPNTGQRSVCLLLLILLLLLLLVLLLLLLRQQRTPPLASYCVFITLFSLLRFHDFPVTSLFSLFDYHSNKRAAVRLSSTANTAIPTSPTTTTTRLRPGTQDTAHAYGQAPRTRLHSPKTIHFCVCFIFSCVCCTFGVLILCCHKPVLCCNRAV